MIQTYGVTQTKFVVVATHFQLHTAHVESNSERGQHVPRSQTHYLLTCKHLSGHTYTCSVHMRHVEHNYYSRHISGQW